MTESPNPDGWDDGRLDAAFVERDRPRPASTTLVPATLQRIAAEPRPTRVRWIGAPHPAMVLAAVAALIAVVGSLSFAGGRPIASLPIASDASRPTVTYGPTASNPIDSAETALGLPIISVKDAIAIRDAGVGDRELAVRGWFVESPAVYDCLILQLVPPVLTGCLVQTEWLTQDREQTAGAGSRGSEFVPPTGPAINPSFDQIDRSWRSSVPELNPRACGRKVSCPPAGAGVSVVAIGHFDDRRAALCKSQVLSRCQDRFVVDRVDSVNGRGLDLSVATSLVGDRVWTLDDIRRLDPLAPNDSRLSVQVVSGHDKSLGIEPTIATDPAWSKESAVWLVRDLVGDRAVTRVIADGSSQVDQIQADGSTIVLHVAPAASDPSWPPTGSIVFAAPPNGAYHLSVAVSDESGHLLDVRSPGAADSQHLDVGSQKLVVDQIAPSRLLVQWGGSMCDHEMTLRITKGGNLVLSVDRDSTCRLALIHWSLELVFDRGVVATELRTQYLVSITLTD